ncbi:hypothetical protein ERJ75_001834000 [Trypanosoma vivax]|nr:hypothetical protein ERJ75_001834000 [Trypanosoma vivax]
MRCSVACASPQIRNPHLRRRRPRAARGRAPRPRDVARERVQGPAAPKEQSRINEWRATQLRGHDAAAHTAAAAIRPSEHATRRADGDNLKHTPEKAARQSAWSMATRRPAVPRHRAQARAPVRKRKGTGRGRASARCALLLPPARARRLAELGAGKGNGPPTAGGRKRGSFSRATRPATRNAERRERCTTHTRARPSTGTAMRRVRRGRQSSALDRRRTATTTETRSRERQRKARERTKRPLGTRRLSSVAAAWPKTRKVREQPDDVGRRWRVEGCSEQRDRRRHRAVEASNGRTRIRGGGVPREDEGVSRDRGKGYSQTG